MLKKFFRKIKRCLMNLYYRIQGYPPFNVFNVENDDDGPDYCQDCDCMLDWDMKGLGDDIVRPGYVTASGDVFCSRCGREYDEEEERLAEEDVDYWPDPQDYDISETDERQDWEPKFGLDEKET
jgi:hypothetical protein